MRLDPSQFQVDPHTKPHLKSWTTDEDGGMDRAAAQPRFERNLDAIAELQYKLFADGTKSVLLVVQGIDTAGKNGVIGDVLARLNPLGVYVKSFKKPEHSELAHDFLWRVHQACPARGMIGVFNRSHYEDVLITRVHKWIDRKQCERRYGFINSFEQMLVDEGTTIVKLFLLISREEQYRRLESRIEEPRRQWKLSLADFEERKYWDDYMEAFNDALAATSTKHAPWFVVPSDKKWYRNLLASEILLSRLKSMDLHWPKPQVDLDAVRKALGAVR